VVRVITTDQLTRAAAGQVTMGTNANTVGILSQTNIDPISQTPLCEQVGQRVTNLLANLFMSGAPDRTCQDQRPTSCTNCWVLVLPEPNKFVGDVA
jgi:hypothetical protein